MLPIPQDPNTLVSVVGIDPDPQVLTTLPPGPGLYVVVDQTEPKAYLGSSEFGLRTRFHRHFRELRGNVHANRHLQKAFNEGHEFKVVPIYVKEGVEVKKLEQELLNEFISTGLLYNICSRVDTAAGMRGMRHSEETKKRMSEAKKGIGPTDAVREAARVRQLGSVRTPEEREVLRTTERNLQQARPISVDGQLFVSIKNAHRSLDVPKATIRYRLGSPSFPSWDYIDNQKEKT